MCDYWPVGIYLLLDDDYFPYHSMFRLLQMKKCFEIIRRVSYKKDKVSSMEITLNVQCSCSCVTDSLSLLLYLEMVSSAALPLYYHSAL